MARRNRRQGGTDGKATSKAGRLPGTVGELTCAALCRSPPAWRTGSPQWSSVSNRRSVARALDTSRAHRWSKQSAPQAERCRSNSIAHAELAYLAVVADRAACHDACRGPRCSCALTGAPSPKPRRRVYSHRINLAPRRLSTADASTTYFRAALDHQQAQQLVSGLRRPTLTPARSSPWRLELGSTRSPPLPSPPSAAVLPPPPRAHSAADAEEEEEADVGGECDDTDDATVLAPPPPPPPPLEVPSGRGERADGRSRSTASTSPSRTASSMASSSSRSLVGDEDRCRAASWCLPPFAAPTSDVGADDAEGGNSCLTEYLRKAARSASSSSTPIVSPAARGW